MTKYTFEFISNYNGWSDYRLYIDGRSDTKIRLHDATGRLSYADGSGVLLKEVKAFAEMKEAQRLAALAKYPEYANERFLQHRTYEAAP